MSDDGKIVVLHCETRLDIPPDRVLEGAVGELSCVVVVGYDHAGDYYFASSTADDERVLWLLEQLKRRVLDPGPR